MPGKLLGGSMPTECLATSCPQQQVHLLLQFPSLPHLPQLAGLYSFQVSLSETTAQASVEFWLSPTSNPQQSLPLAFTAVSSKVGCLPHARLSSWLGPGSPPASTAGSSAQPSSEPGGLVSTSSSSHLPLQLVVFCPSLQSCGVYYFEFLEQSYNGRAIAEVMVCVITSL